MKRYIKPQAVGIDLNMESVMTSHSIGGEISGPVGAQRHGEGWENWEEQETFSSYGDHEE